MEVSYQEFDNHTETGTKTGDLTMTTTMTNREVIEAIANEFDRLFPNDVDETPTDFGEGMESGHKGHTGYEGYRATVGWFTDGGSSGYPLMTFDGDLSAVLGKLKTLSSVRDLEQLYHLLKADGLDVKVIV